MESTDTDWAIAGAAVVLALLEKLSQRGILGRGDALSVLQTAPNNVRERRLPWGSKNHWGCLFQDE